MLHYGSFRRDADAEGNWSDGGYLLWYARGQLICNLLPGSCAAIV